MFNTRSTIKIFAIAISTLGIFLLTQSVSHAATFTVDSTGDQTDLTTNGLCATSLGTCTLRAAITEANAAAGPHSINFNIPTSDTGYVDFDGGAGDGLSGDDYWTMVPATALPTITATGVTINGATQTTNQGDKNTSGPEIEINGTTAGEVKGLVFSGINGTLNSLTLNRFGSAVAAVEVTADGFTITNSYIGVRAKGLTGDTGTNRSAYGVYLNQASGVVGNNINDGNVIAGNSSSNLFASCGTGGSGKAVTIAGNKIGLGADALTIILSGSGIGLHLVDDCIATVGGIDANYRNYIGSTSYGVYMLPAANAVYDYQFYSNYIGRGSGGAGRSPTNACMYLATASDYFGAQNPIIIGANTMGNLLTCTGTTSVSGGINANRSRSMEIAYNSISRSTTGGLHLIVVSGDSSSSAYTDLYIHHNTITNSGPGVGIFTSDINGAEISYNDVTNSTTGNVACINSQGGNDALIHHNTTTNGRIGITSQGTGSGDEVYNNTVTLAKHTGSPGFGGGFYISSGSNHHYHDNIVNANDASGIMIGGLTGAEIGPNIIENNTITGNTRHGIHLGGNRSDIIRGNTITGNTQVGIFVDTGGGTYTIEDNTVSGNTQYGVRLHSGSVTVNGNDINSNVLSGVRVSGSTGHKIQSNGITGNSTSNPTITDFEIVLSTGTQSSSNILDNDAGDIDAGFNTQQNWPEITEVLYIADGEYRVSGRLDGNATEGPFEIEVCEADTHTSNHGSCLDPLGVTETASTPDVVDGANNWFNWTVDVQTQYSGRHDGIIFTSLATNNANSTSQFGINFTCPDETTCPTYIPPEEPPEEEPSEEEPAQEEPEPEVTYEFDLLDPINGETISDTTPALDWEDIDPASELDFYDLYVDGLFVKNTGKVSEFTLTGELSNGSHTWQVIAYKFVDGEAIEIDRTSVEKFVVNFEAPVTPPVVEPPVIKPPVTGENPPKPTTPSLPDFLMNSRNFKVESLTPAAGIVAATATVALSTALLTAGRDILEKLGFVIGGIVPKKRRYWGIVFDAHKSQGIPFAVIRVYDSNKKLINTTVTDLDGRYGIPISESGTYEIEVKARGYKSFSKDIILRESELKEIVENIGLERGGEKLDPFRSFFFYYLSEILVFLRITVILLMVIGFLYSLSIFIQFPILLNLIVLLIYLGLFVFNMYQELRYRRNVEGRAIDLDMKTGLANTTIILYNSKSEQEDLRLTNAKGIAKLRAKSGQYQVQALKSGYSMADLESGQNSLELKVDERGYLTKAIFMRKSS